MIVFRALLGLILGTLITYTVIVVNRHGMGLLPVFFGDIAAFTWPGQFNLDFMFMLTLAAIWVAWRHRFSAVGLGLGFLALIGGALFMSCYLLVESYRAKGDARALLLGRRSG
ncbi:MAG: hypothetical protein CTY25_04770 [Methylobacterium sp.]|nr:MAG: hypothetical protein CTY25_04770 [Methylobacterium sp.]